MKKNKFFSLLVFTFYLLFMGGPNIGGNFLANPSGTGFSETCIDADEDGIDDTGLKLNAQYLDYLPLSLVTAAVDNYVWVTGYSSNVAKIDKTTGAVTYIPVGDTTFGVAVDQDFAWVAGNLGVMKIDKQTDAVTPVASFSHRAYGIAVDPDFIWVGVTGDYNIYKIDKTSNAITSIYVGGDDSTFIAVDSDFVWVTYDTGTLQRALVKIDKRTDAILDIIYGNRPNRLVVDKDFVWVSDYYSYNIIRKIDRQTNSVVAVITTPTMMGLDMAVDDSFVWANSFTGTYPDYNGVVYKIDKATNSIVATTVPLGGLPDGLAMDQDHVWSVAYAVQSAFKIDKSTAAIVSTIPLGFEPNMIGDGTGYDYYYWFGAISVSIDIKPGSFPNTIKLGSEGTVPVAIFSTGTFDARTVDPLTVTLASAPVKLKGKGTPMASAEDVNGDGLLDLVVHVSTEALQVTETDTEAVLEGRTFDGMPIRGADSIRVIP